MKPLVLQWVKISLHFLYSTDIKFVEYNPFPVINSLMKSAKNLTKQLPPLIRQTYLLCANSLLVLIDGEMHISTHAYTECLWSVKMSTSLGEAHMHFRGVPLIQHEIQFKTWSGSCSLALIQRQIPIDDWELWLLRQAHVGVSTVNTHVPRVNKLMESMLCCGSLVCFLFGLYSFTETSGNISQLFVFIFTLLLY